MEGAVSCWRSVFIANAFSKLSTARRASPTLSLILLVRPALTHGASSLSATPAAASSQRTAVRECVAPQALGRQFPPVPVMVHTCMAHRSQLTGAAVAPVAVGRSHRLCCRECTSDPRPGIRSALSTHVGLVCGTATLPVAPSWKRVAPVAAVQTRCLVLTLG